MIQSAGRVVERMTVDKLDLVRLDDGRITTSWGYPVNIGMRAWIVRRLLERLMLQGADMARIAPFPYATLARRRSARSTFELFGEGPEELPDDPA